MTTSGVPMGIERWLQRLVGAVMLAPAAVWACYRMVLTDPCSPTLLSELKLVLFMGLPYVAMFFAFFTRHRAWMWRLATGWAFVMVFFCSISSLNSPTANVNEWDTLVRVVLVMNIGVLAAAILTSIHRKELEQDIGKIVIISAGGVVYFYSVLIMSGGGALASTRFVSAQTRSVAALRTLNVSLKQYATSYADTGFSPTLAALGPNGGPPTAGAADLIDGVLARGEKSGYRYTYSPGQRDTKGRIVTYTIQARPLRKGPFGCRSFFTDQTGIIRQTSEDRPANASDPPI